MCRWKYETDDPSTRTLFKQHVLTELAAKGAIGGRQLTEVRGQQKTSRVSGWQLIGSFVTLTGNFIYSHLTFIFPGIFPIEIQNLFFKGALAKMAA